MNTRGRTTRTRNRGGMGDWWSDLVFNWNPANSDFHNQYITPVVDVVAGIYGIPAGGELGNIWHNTIENVLTGQDIQKDLPPVFGLGPTQQTKPAATTAAGSAPAGQPAPAEIPWGTVALVGGGAALAVGLGAWWWLRHKGKV